MRLRAIRGDRNQAEMAELIGLPYRTYQDMEQGIRLPQQATLDAYALAAKRLGLIRSETELFLDPDLTKPTWEQAKQMLLERIGDEPPKATALSPSSLAQTPSESRRSGRK